MKLDARSIGALLAALLALPSCVAPPSSGSDTQPPYIAGTCTNCHGTHGRSAGAMPSLAGLPRPYLIEQMKQFREGGRPATIMHEIAKGYSDEQTARIADYFARQSSAQ